METLVKKYIYIYELYLFHDNLIYNLSCITFIYSYDEDRREIYYFNFKTGKAQWEHPLDEVYRNLVKKVRNETVVTAG